MLIYFASDETRDLRAEALRRLSGIGRVVFGLQANEVGHISPQWTERDAKNIKQRAEELKKKGFTREDLSGIDKRDDDKVIVEVNEEGEIKLSKNKKSSKPNKGIDLVQSSEQSPKSVHMHGSMALVEWLALAGCQWLVTHSGTSFSTSAAGLGFAPSGHLERLSVVYSKDNVAHTHRRDWEKKNCPVKFSYDDNKSCLNQK